MADVPKSLNMFIDAAFMNLRIGQHFVSLISKTAKYVCIIWAIFGNGDTMMGMWLMVNMNRIIINDGKNCEE